MYAFLFRVVRWIYRHDLHDYCWCESTKTCFDPYIYCALIDLVPESKKVGSHLESNSLSSLYL